eukprot:scaffold117928_cov32-Prasinocladus_malaysianus.AAC.1
MQTPPNKTSNRTLFLESPNGTLCLNDSPSPAELGESSGGGNVKRILLIGAPKELRGFLESELNTPQFYVRAYNGDKSALFVGDCLNESLKLYDGITDVHPDSISTVIITEEPYSERLREVARLASKLYFGSLESFEHYVVKLQMKPAPKKLARRLSLSHDDSMAGSSSHVASGPRNSKRRMPACRHKDSVLNDGMVATSEVDNDYREEHETLCLYCGEQAISQGNGKWHCEGWKRAKANDMAPVCADGATLDPHIVKDVVKVFPSEGGRPVMKLIFHTDKGKKRVIASTVPNRNV